MRDLEFNPERTLKEENVRMLTDVWDFKEEKLKSSKKCMDINCAFGYTTRYLLFPKLLDIATILGIDSSEKMIDHARGNYKNFRRINFEVFDIQSENLPNHYITNFDHIFSFPTLHSHNNIQQEFENIYKILKPGGYFRSCMIISHDVYKLYERMANHPTFGSYFKKYIFPFSDPENQVMQLLRRIGFIIGHYQVVENMKYRSNYLIPFIFYGLSFINELSTEQQKELKNELTNTYKLLKRRIDQCRNDPTFEDTGDDDVYDVLFIHAHKLKEDDIY